MALELNGLVGTAVRNALDPVTGDPIAIERRLGDTPLGGGRRARLSLKRSFNRSL